MRHNIVQAGGDFMDSSQRIDPNQTVLGAPPSATDPMRTQAMPAQGGQATVATDVLKALTVELIPSRQATMANGPAREQFLIQLAASGGPGPAMGVVGSRTRLNLCLVIDRSGSMEGPPLEYVKQACNYVVDLLAPDDVLSIVTFEEIVDVLMPPQRVTNRQTIKDGVSRIVAGNTTDLYGGMALAAQQLLATPDPGRATRMVVLTDGEPTVGIKDYASLVQHAGQLKSQGITITFLGFGPDYNEEMLAGMAKKAGGNYYYIPQPHLIPEVFRTELEKLMTVAARNLKLDLKLARWVTMRSAQFAADRPGDREFSVALADIERGALMQQVVDLEFPNHPLGHYRVAAGRLNYEDCLSGRTEAVDLDFVMEFTSDEARYSVPPDPRVLQAAEIAMASRAVEKTIMGLKSGQVTVMNAIADLQKTQQLLLAQGRTAEAQEVTMALRALQSGDAGTAEKTLIGTMVQLDQGKRQG